MEVYVLLRCTAVCCSALQCAALYCSFVQFAWRCRCCCNVVCCSLSFFAGRFVRYCEKRNLYIHPTNQNGIFPLFLQKDCLASRPSSNTLTSHNFQVIYYTNRDKRKTSLSPKECLAGRPSSYRFTRHKFQCIY